MNHASATRYTNLTSSSQKPGLAILNVRNVYIKHWKCKIYYLKWADI